jgi:hypothetical protein
MPEPVISFYFNVNLPFMHKQQDGEEEVDSDDDDDRSVDEVLEQMEGALPDDAIDLGCLEYEIDHSPGLSWRIEDHFYLVPLKGEPYEWALIRITWDDNYGEYDWAVDAVGSGFSDAKEASRAMVFELFERWRKEEDDEDSPAIDERKSFLRRL